MKLLLTLGIPLLVCSSAWAAQIQATDVSAASIQSAIDSAANGDTVLCPANQSATWDNTGISCSKGITLDLNNAVIKRGAGSAVLVNLTTDPTHPFRMTHGTFQESTAANMMVIGGTKDGDFSNAKFRIDNCTFYSSATSAVEIQIYNAWGLFDHCIFMGDDASEMIHNNAWGADSDGGWHDVVTPGGPDAVYIEDCTFSKTNLTTAYFGGTSAIQSYYGARTVVRHSTFNYCQIDQHGTAGMIGARWWEIYNNTFVIPANGTSNQSNVMDIRAGSGVIFNNVMAGSSNDGGGWLGLREEDSGYPALYQIGRGKDEASDPAYLWNNSVKNLGGDPPMVVDGRDFFSNKVKPGYTPYTYPHPLTAGAVRPTVTISVQLN